MRSVPVSPRPRFSVRTVDVTRLFGETVALWRISLEASSGGLLAVHGSNGSGKSTLLRILAGLMTPTAGRVTWTTSGPMGRPRIALVGHATHLFDDLTAIENVVLAARLAHRDDAAAIGLLGGLGISRHAARRARELSAGTRRRLGMARALATDPDVLLVDEPFAGLDAVAADVVAIALATSRDEGRLVVVATHDDVRSRAIATDLLRLDGGRRQASASIPSTALA